jgi:cyclase
LAKRIISCLDVHDGRTTRGQQFGRAEAGELVDVGDPVELAIRYDAEGADELSSTTSPPRRTGAPPCAT